MKTRTLWGISLAVSLLGTWLMFDRMPGINWTAWVVAAAGGLIWTVHRRGRLSRSVLTTGIAAMVIAGAATFTSNSAITVLLCISVILYLAMQMLLSGEDGFGRLTLPFAVTAPPVAFGNAVLETFRRAVRLTDEIKSPAAGAGVRGVALAVPVIVVFALLLSNADPVFAAWRDSIATRLEELTFLPRTVFFLALLTIVLGAYGFAAAGRVTQPRGPSRDLRILGTTERLVLLGSVAVLFWVFLAVQLTYLFGSIPARVGSGVTFAEYARRGFAELTVVATATALLIIVGELLGRSGGRRQLLRGVTFAVLLAVFLLLASAFNRVLLYEAAYGHTVPRLYGKTFMVAVACGLVALCLEVAGTLDAGRLFRRSLATVTILFIGLAYWNHEAWIADRNLDRYASVGKLDVPYLVHDLSPDAVPTIAARLGDLPPALQQEIRAEIRNRYAGQLRMSGDSWSGWNLSRSRAQSSLDASFGLTFP